MENIKSIIESDLKDRIEEFEYDLSARNYSASFQYNRSAAYNGLKNDIQIIRDYRRILEFLNSESTVLLPWKGYE